MSKTGRGVCPGCNREYALTASGVMRYHWAPQEVRRTQGYDCPGCGQVPMSVISQAQCTHWAPVTTEDLEAAAVEVGLGAVPLLFLMHNLEEHGLHLMKPLTQPPPVVEWSPQP